jgi:hypothetical protein
MFVTRSSRFEIARTTLRSRSSWTEIDSSHVEIGSSTSVIGRAAAIVQAIQTCERADAKRDEAIETCDRADAKRDEAI